MSLFIFFNSDRNVILWNWTEERIPSDSTVLKGHRYAVNQVDFSRESLLASCSLDGTTLIWDPRVRP